MIASNLISKKRDGKSLSKSELSSFFNGYLNGEITDAQMSAMLMAIYFKGMSEDETFILVEIMLNSGSKIDFSHTKRYVADKHSTGGVGDKVSIILAPTLACLGIKVPMIAGRGLGYTGGTIDKLESIPGFNTSPNLDQFKRWVNKCGYAIISQTNEICPADKKIYSLRSKTATIPSIPLICGSIMSKKIAEGISGLVLDIKVGNGAFMKTKEQGAQLGKWLKNIGKAFSVSTDAIYTSMNQPLGRFSGLACEVQEAIDCLKGDGPDDLIKITLELGAHILIQSKIYSDKNSASNAFMEAIDSGKAFEKFQQSVNIQGGSIDKLKLKTVPKYQNILKARRDGLITKIDTESSGWCLVQMGCVAQKLGDELDYSAGIEFYKKLGDVVNSDEPVARIFGSNKRKIDNAEKFLEPVFTISSEYKPSPLIL